MFTDVRLAAVCVTWHPNSLTFTRCHF